MTGIGHLELIRESLVAVVNEMRANIIHSSYSSIIYEGHDFSCALVASDGRLIAQGQADNPIHIFAVPYSATEIVRAFAGDINEGDIFLHNDPYTGGTHLNDILMLFPVFRDGALAMFAAIRCHWGDVGGMTPGSLSGRVREIYQEGIRIVPTKICERGKMNTGFLDLLFANMRIARERRGDFNTMLGTARKAGEHLHRLFDRFGGAVLIDAVEALISRSEALMRRRIADIADGVYFAEGCLDSNGHEPDPLPARLRLTVEGETLTADFTGTAGQTMGPTNVGPAMAPNAVASTVKSFLDPLTPVNHGVFNPITIVNPPGSFLNANLPAPCGGMVECRALMVGMMVSALGKAMPEKLVGDLKGGANHVYMSGPKPGGDEIFLLYEYPAAGTGATHQTDGNHGCRAFPEGDFNAVQSAEVLEAQCPVRIDAYGIRDGSFGDGAFRGGCGIQREIRMLDNGAALSVLTDHAVVPPWGVAGGRGGAANRFVVLREGEEISPSPMPGKVGGFHLQKNDIVRVQTSGGGGYGDPLQRDPLRVMQDASLGYLSVEQACRRFGVVLTDSGQVDDGATAALRMQLSAERVTATLRCDESGVSDGPRRRIKLPPSLAQRLAVADGDLIELVAPGSSAPLRGWALLVEGDAIGVDETGLAALGAMAGELAEVRVPPAVPE